MSQRLFVHDTKKWQANCRSHEIEHAEVHAYDDAIVLPMRKKHEFDAATRDGVYEGGVCSDTFEFIAGRRRNLNVEHANFDCDSSYEVPAEDLVHRDETVIFGGCLINHFGHALLDGTARTWYLAEAAEDLRIVFLHYPHKSDVPFDALKFVELMGIDMDRVEVIDRPTQFRRVIVPDEAIYPANAYRPEYVRTFDAIRARIRPMDARKVYLSRSQFGLRPVYNETYYEEFFARRGFVVIHPETLPIEEQIAYVAGADEIVTSIGSMSHLFLFAKDTVTATVLNRSTQCLPGQIIVDQVRGIGPFYVDAFLNPVPSPHVSGPFLFGPNRYFKAYLDERGIPYRDEELVLEDEARNALFRRFMESWTKEYVNRRKRGPLDGFNRAAYRSNTLESFAYYDDEPMFPVDADALLGFLEVLWADAQRGRKQGQTIKKLTGDLDRSRKEKARLSADLKKARSEAAKAKAEVRRLRNSKSWKITAPLRAVTERLAGK
ncbi:glycosyltransferase 61 family protein [Bifidobacterium amazonense]|uniref:Glycosyltransferase 61 family protein n=1 Tax=Bifidobacterium amazonense TaxID=2809027 RepID=A0ABS9VTS1_9BIFI|nr:glycosyltransferase family 61 protein [Bifidobacterium amazonense]MCH9275497.1 glycosyltransferase 61 family protein [Bifidobacterium amazonense]